uniref:Uncharacterized protein n=1 Tax=Cannabis sativa TaxID=3483 RepID=A0A803PYL1_CANSA
MEMVGGRGLGSESRSGLWVQVWIRVWVRGPTRVCVWVKGLVSGSRFEVRGLGLTLEVWVRVQVSVCVRFLAGSEFGIKGWDKGRGRDRGPGRGRVRGLRSRSTLGFGSRPSLGFEAGVQVSRSGLGPRLGVW